MKIKNTEYHSKKLGNLSKGCRLCTKGRKLVLFATGLCSRRCWYCPLAETKKNKDVVFANEWKINKEEDIIKEAELCSAYGAGITGGDPFLRITRASKYIQLLKEQFGRNFHIHLYAPMPLITQQKLKKLFYAGLDEIRLHPDFNNNKDWNKIALVKKFNWDIGIEIPVIPGMKEKAIRMINYFKPHVEFINLNELEISDTNIDAMLKRGLKPKDNITYAVKGSEELAVEIMRHFKNKKLNMHYCTTKLKDAVQLAKRIRLRAKNIKESFDIVNKDGTLLRGAIYLPHLKPDFGYRKKLEKINKKKIIAKLKTIKKKLKFKTKIDYNKPRLLASTQTVKKHKNAIKKQNLVPAIVLEYPTWDEMELEVTFL